ncbi:MAG: Uma2 family endonuclease [Peptococcaceae bacterium]|nr:Uma2 family endonuclease [Peptococcaceae bacterium]MBO5300861.1 Uma2 family endonuclease [Peptococcaceae bacterium]MBO5428533.1 Uma2 family endonuclease [Peptococcaceae bacterium]MBP3624304.1 Uma2 family endonuclease [Peptococcaceae bacterium]
MNAISDKILTAEQFLTMEKDEHAKYELIDGIICMSPSPTFEHQKVASKFVIELGKFFANHGCTVVHELDVRAGEDVFRPDVMVFCDDNLELPEIVIEVLSPSTAKRDLGIKVAKYETAGIKEYWIVDIKSRTVTVHDYVNEVSMILTADEILTTKLYPAMQIEIAKFFA